MNIAYVVIHGFGGNPKDINGIKKELISKKIKKKDIYTPMVYGHRFNKRGIDFSVKYEQMVSDMEKYISKISKKYENVIIIGYSMGALIAMEVAIKINIYKLILINPPIYVWSFKNFIHTIKVSDLKSKKYHIKTVLSSLSITKIRNKMEMTRLQKDVKEKLNKIKCDTLIIKSKRDYVAKPESADYVYNLISSKNKKIIEYDNVSHFIPRETGVNKIINDLVIWINE